VYGNKIAASEFHPNISVIGAIERTQSGYVLLRVGRIWTDTDDDKQHWHQTEHVVLKPREIPDLTRELVYVLDPPRGETYSLRLTPERARDVLAGLGIARPDESVELTRIREDLAKFVEAKS
jgi:hypothetical protein